MTFQKAAVLVFAGFGLALTTAMPAFAHAALIGSSPEKSASVDAIDVVSVTANEDLLDIGENAKGFVLTVRDAKDHFFGDGCVSVDGATASMPVALTEPGRYRVAYRIVSNDGHPIEGGFAFDFSGNDAAEPAPAFAERPVCGVAQEPVANSEPEPTPTDKPVAEDTTETSGEFDLIPWIGLATIPLIIGAIVLLMRVLGKSDSEDHLT